MPSLREYHLTGEHKIMSKLCMTCKYYLKSESDAYENDRCGHEKSAEKTNGVREETSIVYSPCYVMLKSMCRDHRLWEAK